MLWFLSFIVFIRGEEYCTAYEVSSACSENDPLDLVLIIDSSTSISDQDYGLLIDSLADAFEENWSLGSSATMILYSEDIQPRIQWESDPAVAETIREQQRMTGSDQNTESAMRRAFDDFWLPHTEGNPRRRTVLITNGEPTQSICDIASEYTDFAIEFFVIVVSELSHMHDFTCLRNAGASVFEFLDYVSMFNLTSRLVLGCSDVPYEGSYVCDFVKSQCDSTSDFVLLGDCAIGEASAAMEIEGGFIISASDSQSYFMDIKSIEECQALCDQRDDCTAGTLNTNKDRCWIYSGATTLVQGENELRVSFVESCQVDYSLMEVMDSDVDIVCTSLVDLSESPSTSPLSEDLSTSHYDCSGAHLNGCWDTINTCESCCKTNKNIYGDSCWGIITRETCCEVQETDELASNAPSLLPSKFTTEIPSPVPSLSPSKFTTEIPSPLPSVSPSKFTTEIPSPVPSLSPSKVTTEIPSSVPSLSPSKTTSIPSAKPLSSVPSLAPSTIGCITYAPSREVYYDIAPTAPEIPISNCWGETSAPTFIPKPSAAPSTIPSIAAPSLFPLCISRPPSRQVYYDCNSQFVSDADCFDSSRFTCDACCYTDYDVSGRRPCWTPQHQKEDCCGQAFEFADIMHDLSELELACSTEMPSECPSSSPSGLPTASQPSRNPSNFPTQYPTLSSPSLSPIEKPSAMPTDCTQALSSMNDACSQRLTEEASCDCMQNDLNAVKHRISALQAEVDARYCESADTMGYLLQGINQTLLDLQPLPTQRRELFFSISRGSRPPSVAPSHGPTQTCANFYFGANCFFEKFDLALMLDSSSSVTDDQHDLILDSFASGLEAYWPLEDAKFGLMQFAAGSKLEWYLQHGDGSAFATRMRQVSRTSGPTSTILAFDESWKRMWAHDFNVNPAREQIQLVLLDGVGGEPEGICSYFRRFVQYGVLLVIVFMKFIEESQYLCMATFGDSVKVIVFDSFEDTADSAKHLFGLMDCTVTVATPFDDIYSLRGETSNGFPRFESSSGFELTFQDSWTFSDPYGNTPNLVESDTIHSPFPIANQTWTDGTTLFNQVDLVCRDSGIPSLSPTSSNPSPSPTACLGMIESAENSCAAEIDAQRTACGCHLVEEFEVRVDEAEEEYRKISNCTKISEESIMAAEGLLATLTALLGSHDDPNV